ncbi:MAG: MmcQ/YjbR family DNA-binding protein [Dysgonamonadaceae bacterium]|jgi:predicted DNA-binding protein (MmcQ/YjbR family)|nr:MmcQ/YjbR family DNA-binding protein [Dysgonamonadaceae bacterium]
MNVEELYDYCLSIPGAEVTTPFDEVTLVMKICGKMFAFIPLDEEGLRIVLKCDPEKALELRERYSSVVAAYHMNKTYWNAVYVNADMNDDELRQWIRHSVDEVMKKLPKKQQEAYYGERK